MRFVSGRSRLPANPADISQRFQIMKVDRVCYLVDTLPVQQCHFDIAKLWCLFLWKICIKFIEGKKRFGDFDFTYRQKFR